MACLSVRDAAQLAGKSKSTILRAIHSRRLSAARLDNGAYAVDAASFYRVYPSAGPPIAIECLPNPGEEHNTSTDEAGDLVPEIGAVEKKIEILRDRFRAQAARDELALRIAANRTWREAAAAQLSNVYRAILSIAKRRRPRPILLLE
jgi:hypothetical protein